jgi:choline/ethanolamine kinase
MRDVATRICREYLSGAWKTISSDEIQVKRIRCVFATQLRLALELSIAFCSFQWRLIELSVLRELAELEERLAGGEWIEKDTQGQLPQRSRADALLSAAADLRTNPWRTRARDDAHRIRGFHAAERAATGTKAPRNLPRWTHRAVYSGELSASDVLPPDTHNLHRFQARSLTTAELANNQISLKIAEKMSEIHSLDIPVSKEPDWLFLTLNRWLNNVDTIMNDVRNNNNDSVEFDVPKKLSKIDFRKEVQWLRKVVETEAYPVVFCHNDLQEGNILFRQSNFTPNDNACDGDNNPLSDLTPLMISSSPKSENSQGNSSPSSGNSRKRSLVEDSLDVETVEDNGNGGGDEKPELMIIDFEYCAYNYRAFDIANHFLGELDGGIPSIPILTLSLILH